MIGLDGLSKENLEASQFNATLNCRRSLEIEGPTGPFIDLQLSHAIACGSAGIE